jgi:sugar/nucleoside kinase (ribokinase family)
MALGGNGAIAAAAASALGADSSIASTIGDDVWGRWLREALDAAGVGIEQLSVVKGQPTATTLSLVRTDGERALLTHNGASEGHDLTTVDLSAVGEGDWVLLSSLFLVKAYSGEALRRVAVEARGRGANVAMDLSWDCGGDWDLGTLALEEADVVLGNHMEFKAAACSNDLDVAVERMLGTGARALVVKLGAEGARLVTADGTDLTVGAPEVEPVNATGTGDVFNAALLVALAGGRSMEEAVEFACAAGALRVSGGCHTFPTSKEVEDLLGGGG